MREYRATLTINVFITAESEEEANDKLQDMEISFTDPDSHDELQNELIDWEVNDLGDIDDPDIDELDEE